MIFVMGLFKIKLLRRADLVGTVNRVFEKYMDVVRRLQDRYQLQKVPWQGQWGLDDYQMLAYLFGASQLVDS